jgi:hypothetical protein
MKKILDTFSHLLTEKPVWYLWGLLMLTMTERTYGSIQEAPIQLVMILCTVFICGALCGISEKINAK